MNKKQSRTLGILLVFLGLLTVFHHLFLTGRFFDPEDILHHEIFEAVFLTAGLVLLACSYTREKIKP